MNIFKKILTAFFFAAIMVAQPLKSTPTGNQGSWTETDKQDRTVILEWERFDGYTIPCFNHLKELAPIRAAAFVEREIQWCLPLLSQLENNTFTPSKLNLSNDQINDLAYNDLIKIKEELNSGKTLEQIITPHLEHNYVSEYDEYIAKIEKEGPSNRINFIVVAKETNGAILGFATFSIEPDGSVELDVLGILPTAQGRWLSRFLIFSILKIYPETKRIFLGTGKTNIKAQKVYKTSGFVEYNDPRAANSNEGMFFEYIVPENH